MRLERKLTLAVLGLFIPPTVVAGLVLLLLYRRGLLEEPASLLAAVLIGLGAMVGYLILVARGIGHALVRTIEELWHGAELIATVNPEHRLDVRTGDELEALGGEINRLADCLRAARDGTTREERTERERLAAIIDRLTDGVVVASAEGRITLANRAARRLLRGGGGLLGHSLFDFVDRETIAGRPCIVRTAAGTARGMVCALADDEGADGGFILSLHAPDGESAGEPGELYDFSLLETMERHVGPAQREHRLDALTFVVFDTETTGLRPEAGDRVVSLAGVRVRGGRVRHHETFDTLVDPGRGVPQESVRIHGITSEMLVGAPPLETALPAFLEFAGPAVLVGHEVAFDLRFLEPQARRLGLPSLAGRHSALGDALITAEVLVRLLALVQKRGILTLGQALDAIRSARRVTI
jgi:DNA polymerase III epsilon subunit-like protein